MERVLAGAHLSNGKERWEPRGQGLRRGVAMPTRLGCWRTTDWWGLAHDHGWRGVDYRRPVRRAGDCLRATNHQAHPPDCARACACTCVCARAPSNLPHSAHSVTPVRGLCPNARVPRLPACPPVFVHARTQAHTHTRHEASPGTLPHPRISPHSGCRPGVVLLARAVGACKGGQSWRE